LVRYAVPRHQWGMDTNHSSDPTTPLIELLRRAAGGQIAARIHALDDERKSLVALLRSVRARERAAARREAVGV
jgi:hypothetical protein